MWSWWRPARWLTQPDVPGLEAALASGFARNIDRALGEGPETLPEGPVVVWGAAEGIELALDLARAGRKVRLLEPAATFAPTSYIGSRTRYVMMWAGEVGLTPEAGVALDSVGNGIDHRRARRRTQGRNCLRGACGLAGACRL